MRLTIEYLRSGGSTDFLFVRRNQTDLVVPLETLKAVSRPQFDRFAHDPQQDMLNHGRKGDGIRSG
jgi:hypothetical protein